MLDKLEGWGDSIFSVMTAKANQHNALNLAQGFPDFQIDSVLKDHVLEAMNGNYNQYSRSYGSPLLIRSIESVIKEIYHADIDGEEWITVVPGATFGIYVALQALIHRGDEVIYIEPAYDSYEPSILMAGGIPVAYRSIAPTFAVDWEELQTLITPATRLIIVNNPNNPTGAALEKSDLEILGRIAEQHDLLVLSDEVYEFIRLKAGPHIPAYTIPGLKDRAVCLSSFGKTLHVTGWKVGYMVASPHLTGLLRKVNQFAVFSTNHPMQIGIARYLENKYELTGVAGRYKDKLRMIQSFLSDSRFKAMPCDGTYFLMLDYSAISDRGSYEFALDLVEQHGIATIPVSAFYSCGVDPHLLRICFAKVESTLIKAGNILCKI